MRFFLVIMLSFLLCFPGVSSGQKQGKKITISGKVTNTRNEPVAGAAIFIDKVKTNVVTGADGYYKIKVKPDAGEILVFTLFDGAAEQIINGRSVIDIKLEGDTSGIPGSAKDYMEKAARQGKSEQVKDMNKSDASVIEFKASRSPVYHDIYDMIRGKLAGVEVSGKSIKIRGTSSLNISTEPLFVVDGVIVSSVDGVIPDDVKSIEVLKGPDATAYGTRGSNGVILITRKSGKDQ
jgi:TonB-dependent SusC/RagA subfamily outer membrane receptor